MTRLGTITLVTFALTNMCKGSDELDLEKWSSGFDGKVSTLKADFAEDKAVLGNQYAGALEKLRDELAKSTGDLDRVLAINGEIERIGKGEYAEGELPEEAAALRRRFDELLSKRSRKFQADVWKVTGIQAERLKKLERQLTKAQRVDEAVTVRKTFESLHATIAKRMDIPLPGERSADGLSSLSKKVAGRWTWIPQEKEQKGLRTQITLSPDGNFIPAWKKQRGKWHVDKEGKVLIEAEDWNVPVTLTFDKNLKSFEARFGIRRKVSAIGEKLPD